MNPWVFVIIGGVLLGAMSYAIELAEDADGWGPELLLIALAVGGIWAVQKAVEVLPAGVAMAAATGLAGIVALGVGAVVLKEALSGGQMLAGAVMAAGTIGLVATSMR